MLNIPSASQTCIHSKHVKKSLTLWSIKGCVSLDRSKSEFLRGWWPRQSKYFNTSFLPSDCTCGWNLPCYSHTAVHNNICNTHRRDTTMVALLFSIVFIFMICQSPRLSLNIYEAYQVQSLNLTSMNF